MRYATFISILQIVLISLASATQSVSITHTGRKTQLDGFLVDWIEKNRLAWNGSTVWSLDAINTKDGVAGYFYASGKPACSSWVFKVETGRNGPHAIIASAAKDTETNIYCVNRDRQSSITVEWIFPWDSIAVDENGNYAITIQGNSTCGDSLEPLGLTGKMFAKTGSLPKNFAPKILMIILLLAVFIVLQIRIRKKTRRKESPRQSA
jgi:hypothetical protein